MKRSEELFYRVWRVLYPEGDVSKETRDADVRRCVDRMYDAVKNGEPDYDGMWANVCGRVSKVSARKWVTRRVLRYAAAVTLPLFLFLGGLLFFDTGQPSLPRANPLERPDNAIILKLSDGTELNLRESVPNQVFADASVEIHRDSVKGLVYEEGMSCDTMLYYNTIEVPVAADYRLQLSDGTVVYLNSDSKLKYPAVFKGGERKVYLQGEGYFEVQKDAGRPFRVEVGETEIEVLGTSFNVNAYPEKEGVQTTLVEGRVKVKESRSVVILHPGEQASCSAGRIQVAEVDVREFTSWKDGLFIFNRMSLENIMKQMERWYGVTVVYGKEDVKGYTFTGMIDKNLPAHETFKVIEKVVDVRFSVEDGKIVITK